MTEVGLLNFRTTDFAPETIQNFIKAQEKQCVLSKHPTLFFRQVEDPKKVYIIGGWEKNRSPIAKWFVSHDHLACEKLRTDDLEGDWVVHLELDMGLRLIQCGAARIPLSAPVVAITRYFVRPDKTKEFDASYESLIARHAANEAPYSYAGGWRIGGRGLNKEFVFLTGWNEVGDYHLFAAKHVKDLFEGIKSSLKCIQIKQMRPETWE
ncbi:hypothetical protein N7466_007262 [Penicillium verhagenii]|uniref:uncharacterized protein n=1 Tax=Penicillium verhagenii TaxID=1562060 RepID=UPI002545606D|nr:uncharacterized protein N7466_007262 [Penicillium verhagenii]KAJ5928306.1 hypothetical protein N7466_007262 [Penicillium verhagenii]